MMRDKKNFKGQVILEYAVIIGLVVAIMLAMSPKIKRLIQGMVKITADQVGAQTEADQFHQFLNTGNFVTDVHKPKLEDGYLESSYTYVRTVDNKRTLEAPNISDLGVTNYVYSVNAVTNTSSLSNLGFIEEKF
jgi:hypothetical protein